MVRRGSCCFHGLREFVREKDLGVGDLVVFAYDDGGLTLKCTSVTLAFSMSLNVPFIQGDCVWLLLVVEEQTVVRNQCMSLTVK